MLLRMPLGRVFPLIDIFPKDSVSWFMINQMRKAMTKGLMMLAKKINPNIINAMDASVKNTDDDFD